MKVAYIAGPYRAATTHEIDQNIDKAKVIAKKYWQLGYAVICPHMNSAHFDGLLPDRVWLTAGLIMIERCDVIVMMGNWEQSAGAVAERERARRLGKEIIYDASRK